MKKRIYKIMFCATLGLAHYAKAMAIKPSPRFNLDENAKSSVLFLPISHPDVKHIKIVDNGEELVDLLQIDNPRIRHMSTISNDYSMPYEGCSKVRKGVYECLIGMLGYLPKNIGIAYQEGWRPLSVQKKYFDEKFLSLLLKYKDDEVAYSETSKYVSPFIENVPTHCTGAAIDMTLFLISETGEISLMNLGMFDTIYGQNNHEETFSENVTDEQLRNRMMLLTAAIKGGFVNYGYEWWHYSYGDKPWAFVKHKKNALYGLAVSEKDKTLLESNKTEYIESMKQKIASKDPL